MTPVHAAVDAAGPPRPGRPRRRTSCARRTRRAPERRPPRRWPAAAASLRRDGTWSGGPSTSPMRSWPSECRCRDACSTATASSQETPGKPRLSTAALISTDGQPALGAAAGSARAARRPARTAHRRTPRRRPAAASSSSTYSASETPPAVCVHSTGVKPLLREGAADDLGERREDRVLQLGQHQPDQPGPLAAQLGGALVAQHVQRGEHGCPGVLGDPGLAVEHPADRGLADPDLLRHLCQSPACHARKCTPSNCIRLHRLAVLATRCGGTCSAAPRRPP